MFIDFKNRKWQSVSRILLILCLLSIVVGLFFYDKDFTYHFQPDYYNHLNKIEFSLIFGLVLAIFFTGAVSEEKYIFSISSIFLTLRSYGTLKF